MACRHHHHRAGEPPPRLELLIIAAADPGQIDPPTYPPPWPSRRLYAWVPHPVCAFFLASPRPADCLSKGRRAALSKSLGLTASRAAPSSLGRVLINAQIAAGLRAYFLVLVTSTSFTVYG